MITNRCSSGKVNLVANTWEIMLSRVVSELVAQESVKNDGSGKSHVRMPRSTRVRI